MEIQELIPIDYAGQRVLTTAQLADIYGTTPARIKDNFRYAKEQFEEGVHYFKVTGEALRALKSEVGISDLLPIGMEQGKNSALPSPISKMASCVYLWTKEGCVRHCKMLNTPNALEIWEELRRNYFEEEPAKVDALLIRTVKGIRCYVDGDMVAHINAEDVARGLGFVEMKDGKEYVMWRRINGYLREWGFSADVSKDDYLPENVFYRLAMKANNAAAKTFQAKIADEILPSIRKHGYYVSPASSPESKKMAFELHEAGQKLLDSTDKMVPRDKELAHELIAIADKIHDDSARDKILIHAANLLVGQELF